MKIAQIWPDDTQRAALILAQASHPEPDVDLVASFIDEVIETSARPIELILEIIRLMSQGLGAGFNTPQMTAAFQKLATKAHADEETLRQQGMWRDQNG